MYADNNQLEVGDKIEIAGEELVVTGYVALPDYSCLFSDNSDMMFDAVKFGVGIMTEEGTDVFGTTHLEYRYSWQYETAQRMILKRKTCRGFSGGSGQIWKCDRFYPGLFQSGHYFYR